jgi:hypothetical protein
MARMRDIAGKFAGANIHRYTDRNLNEASFNLDREILFNVTSEPIVSSISGTMAEDKKMLLRHSPNDTSGGKYLSVVSDSYRVVENQEILLPLQDQLRNFFDPSVVEDIKVRDVVSRNGATCLSEYVLPKVNATVTTGTGHRTTFGLTFMLKNTFDGSASVVMYSGIIDYFCLNGNITGSYDVTRRRHTSGFNTTGFIHAFENTLKRFDGVIEQYQIYADAKIVDRESVLTLFKKLTGHNTDRAKERNRESIADKLYGQYAREAIERGGNVFSVMSAMTHYASHNDEIFRVTRGGDDSVMVKRQEQVNKWLESDLWAEFLHRNNCPSLAAA